MGWEGVSDEMWGVTSGRYSRLVGLRSGSQSLDQLVLAFREFWKIPWRLREVMSLTLSAKRGLSSDKWSGRSLTKKTNSIGPMTEPWGKPLMVSVICGKVPLMLT